MKWLCFLLWSTAVVASLRVHARTAAARPLQVCYYCFFFFLFSFIFFFSCSTNRVAVEKSGCTISGRNCPFSVVPEWPKSGRNQPECLYAVFRSVPSQIREVPAGIGRNGTELITMVTRRIRTWKVNTSEILWSEESPAGFILRYVDCQFLFEGPNVCGGGCKTPNLIIPFRC